MIQIRSVTGFCDPDGGTQGGAISPHQLKHATLVDLSIPVEVDLFLTGGGSFSLDSMAIKMPGGWWSEAEPASGHHFTIILIHTRCEPM